jgi:hypothetical protein
VQADGSPKHLNILGSFFFNPKSTFPIKDLPVPCS